MIGRSAERKMIEFLVPSSFALNPCLLDDRAPHRSLGRKPRGQLCRSRNNHGGADSVISLSDKWVLQRRNRIRDELADDLAWSLGLDIQPPPGRDVEALNGFRDGGMSGAAGERFGDVTAMPRMVLLWCCDRTPGRLLNMASIRPGMRSFMASAAPR